MTTIDYEGVPAALPERRATSRFGLLRDWFAKRREQRQMRASMLELSRLDDRLLRDIGISHGDIRDALSGRRSSVWLDPMRRDRQE
jgi:uncharacterized protein YjiS (DUF1127 family)